jgi:hypothetical protein
MIKLISATALVLTSLAVSSPSMAAPNNHQGNNDGKVLECELLGGTVVPQPAGSNITACCYDEGEIRGCWICDENGNDCTFDEAYRNPVFGQRPWLVTPVFQPQALMQLQIIAPNN